MKRTARTTLLAALVAAALAGPLHAASATWNKGTGNWLWSDSANWSVSPPPGPGDTATLTRIDWAKPIAIDMKGSGYNLKEISGTYNGSCWVFYDSDHLTPNANPLGTNQAAHTNFTYAPYGSLVEAANASPTLQAEDIRFGKEHAPVFLVPLQITDELWPTEHATMYFYGNVAAGRVTSPSNNGWGSTINFKSNLTAGTVTIPDRGDAAQETLNVEGLATIGTLNAIGAKANFKDLHLTTQLRQNNDSIINVSGRFSGTATYVQDGGTPSLNLLAGSTLAPGASIGTLGSLALTVSAVSGGTYEWEVGASPRSSTAGVGWDLAVAGTFVLGGDIAFKIVELGLAEEILPSDRFLVLQAGNFDITGVQNLTFEVIGDLATWNVEDAELLPDPQLGGLVLTGISASFQTEGEIPEPATMALLALASLGLGGYARRRGARSAS